MKKKTSIGGILGALAANIIFGFSFIFSKIALGTGAHPLVILSVRFSLAFLVLTVLILCRAVKVNYKGKPLKKLALMGFMQPFCYFIFELYGLKMTSSALSGIIISLVPVFVLVYSALFSGEKPTLIQIIGTFVSVAGVVAVSVMAENTGKTKWLGILLLVGAVVSATGFNVLSRDQSAVFTPIERTYFMFALGTVGFNLVTLAVLNKDYGTELVKAVIQPPFWLAMVYLSVVSSVLAFLCYNVATTRLTAVQSSSFSNIITVISVLAGILIMKEPFSWLEMLICIPIIAGVWVVNKE